jgi:hypothetical protein
MLHEQTLSMPRWVWGLTSGLFALIFCFYIFTAIYADWEQWMLPIFVVGQLAPALGALAASLALLARPKLISLRLSSQGFEQRFFGSRRHVRWRDVSSIDEITETRGSTQITQIVIRNRDDIRTFENRPGIYLRLPYGRKRQEILEVLRSYWTTCARP